MTFPAPAAPGARPHAFRWSVAGTGAALALGSAAAFDGLLAMALAVAVAIFAAALARPLSMLGVLAITVFVEFMNVNGVTVSRLIAPIALLVVLFEVIRGSAYIRWGSPLPWVFAYASWALASGLWTVSVEGTTFLLASLGIALVYMAAFAALIDSERDLRQVLYVFAFASLVVGASSIAAFAGRPLGLGVELQEGRAQGGVGDPNFLAAYQLAVLPPLLVLAAQTRTLWLRYGLYGTSLVIIGSVFASLSRGGIIAMAALVLLLVLIPARSLFHSERQKKAMIVILLFGVAFLLSRPFVREEVLGRVETIYSNEEQSGDVRGSGRVNLWLAARTAIDERPFHGLGYGSFKNVSRELMYRTPGVDFTFYRPRPIAEAHSLYIGTWAELGLVGFILYIGLLLSTARALRRTAVRARRAGAQFVSRMANALVLSVLAWSLTSIFLSTETSRPFWIVVGLALALPKLIPSQPEDRRSPGWGES